MVRSRLFCCCLPVRFGVFTMSILYFALGGLVGISGWLQVKDLQKLNYNTRDKAALILATVIYTLLALVSILGFIGSIVRSRNCIALYRTVLSLHLGFSIASGIFYIVSLFQTDRETNYVNTCVEDLNSKASSLGSLSPADSQQQCQRGFQIFRGVVIGVFVLIWLIELWGCIICSDYVEQLEDEQDAQDYKHSGSNVTTYNVTNYGAPAQTYPFAQPANAHGPTAAHNV